MPPVSIINAAGGVVIRRARSRLVAAMVGDGNPTIWRLPKGIVEPFEGQRAAAVREVEEETNLRARVEADLGYSQWKYAYEGKKYSKRTRFFLMRWVGGALYPKDREHLRATWIPVSQLPAKLYFRSEKRVAEKALAILNRKSASKYQRRTQA